MLVSVNPKLIGKITSIEMFSITFAIMGGMIANKRWYSDVVKLYAKPLTFKGVKHAVIECIGGHVAELRKINITYNIASNNMEEVKGKRITEIDKKQQHY